MQEFITQAAQSLGVPESGIQSATGGLLGLLKDKADAADFSALAAQVPGVADLAATGTAAAAEAGGGGMLGMATSALSKLGGGVGGAASLISMFEKSGLQTDQAGPFVSMFVGFLQKQGGSDLVGRLLSSVPELKKLAG